MECYGMRRKCGFCFHVFDDLYGALAGRNYLKSYSAGYFEEQKGILWHQHKQELDKWHGPFMDDSGRQSGAL